MANGTNARLFHRPACRLWLALRIAWLRWDIASDQQWIDDAARAGIFSSANLAYVRRHMQAKRVRLAVALAERDGARGPAAIHPGSATP